MDDEEYQYQPIQEPLYRVETGNYEYRLILRCRQDAKIRFANLRSDVLVKLELLDNKHVQDVITQMQKLISCLATMNTESYKILKEANYFPLDVDLSSNCSFTYPDPNQSPYTEQHDDDDEETGEEEKKIEKEILEDMGIEVKEDADLRDLFSNLSLPSASNEKSPEKKIQLIDTQDKPKTIDQLLE